VGGRPAAQWLAGSARIIGLGSCFGLYGFNFGAEGMVRAGRQRMLRRLARRVRLKAGKEV